MKSRVVMAALGLAGFALISPLASQSTHEAAIQEMAAVQPVVTPAAPALVSIATLPTTTPPTRTTSPRAGYAAASLPSVDPLRSVSSLPTVTPLVTPERTGCDPSYPETRTCIPPGPPFAQGCAITAERLFRVLPPDPQRLDHDADGIGCEPIGGRT